MSRARQIEDRRKIKTKRSHGASQRGVIKLNSPSAQKLRHAKDFATGVSHR